MRAATAPGTGRITLILTLQFDEAADAAIRRLWAMLTPPSAAHGRRPAKPVERYRPHVTLAAYESPSADPFHEVLTTLCRARRPFPVRFHAIGVFPETRVVFLSPIVTDELARLHADVLDRFTGADWPALAFSRHLGRNVWTPHCTLLRARTREQAGWAVETLERGWRGIEASCTAIGIHELRTTTDVHRCEFGA